MNEQDNDLLESLRDSMQIIVNEVEFSFEISYVFLAHDRLKQLIEQRIW